MFLVYCTVTFIYFCHCERTQIIHPLLYQFNNAATEEFVQDTKAVSCYIKLSDIDSTFTI